MSFPSRRWKFLLTYDIVFLLLQILPLVSCCSLTGLHQTGRGRTPSFEMKLRAQSVELGPYRYEKAVYGSPGLYGRSYRPAGECLQFSESQRKAAPERDFHIFPLLHCGKGKVVGVGSEVPFGIFTFPRFYKFTHLVFNHRKL
jgi:hypothetical protein